MARIIYAGADITDDIEIATLNVVEDSGETPDAIDMIVTDVENQWSRWEPKKGELLEVQSGAYASGTMYVDEFEQNRGSMTLRAISAPITRKTKRTKSWEATTLLTLVAEKAADYGFEAKFYGLSPQSYARVDQLARGDFAFLSERCLLEGCSLKICNNCLIVYADKQMEDAAPIKTIAPDLFFDEPVFRQNSEIYAACRVTNGGIVGVYRDAAVDGSELTISNINVTIQGEAERFAKNILRAKNKKEFSGSFSTVLDTSITAGNTILIAGLGRSDGKYFIDNARHCFAEEISDFKVHKVLERY